MYAFAGSAVREGAVQATSCPQLWKIAVSPRNEPAKLAGSAISIFMRLQPVGSFVSGNPAIENLFHLLGKKLEAPDIIVSQGQKSGLGRCVFENLDGSV